MKHGYQILIIGVILIVAGFFRLYQLDIYPPGLYPDEAMNGTNALEAIETGNYKVFYPENNGREGLFINIQSVSVDWFGNFPWSLRLVSALMGILTVWGVYFLARELFNWQIAAFSSFMMAVSFWHVNFSRIGFRAIMAPLLLTWGFYFFWRGLKSGRYGYFLASGLVWGLGAHTYIAYRIMPFPLLLALGGYLASIRKDFAHEKYVYARRRIAIGMAVFAVSAFLVFLPLLMHFMDNPADFFGRTNKTSVFNTDNPLLGILKNTGLTLGMFTFFGDQNWRHNIAGQPVLFWPVGVMFVVGFVRSIFNLIKIKRKHGHFSPVQTLLLSWFILGLAPTFLSNEGLPHALRAIIVAPVVFIFAGKGLWWFFEGLERWYLISHPHDFSRNLPHHRKMYLEESLIVSVATVLIFFTALGAAEYFRYFKLWGQHQATASEFTERYVDLASQINNLPIKARKYVVVNAGDVYVGHVSVHARTIMYLTGTWSQEKQEAKNIYYITEEEFLAGDYPEGVFIFPLKPFK